MGILFCLLHQRGKDAKELGCKTHYRQGLADASEPLWCICSSFSTGFLCRFLDFIRVHCQRKKSRLNKGISGGHSFGGPLACPKGINQYFPWFLVQAAIQVRLISEAAISQSVKQKKLVKEEPLAPCIFPGHCGCNICQRLASRVNFTSDSLIFISIDWDYLIPTNRANTHSLTWLSLFSGLPRMIWMHVLLERSYRK